MMNITVIGAGYVGLVTAACFADLGNKVTVIEIDSKKIKSIEHGHIPIYEPGLPEMWKRNQEKQRLTITNNYIKGLLGADFVFIAVGTPSTKTGRPDLRWVRSAIKGVAEAASGSLIVVLKSTVPVGTADQAAEIIAGHSRNGYSFPIISNPEFMREGLAIFDFMNPTRIVVGGSDQNAINMVSNLYETIQSPLITCDNRSAEMSKYASNVFLASRISFINEIALLCEQCDADIKKVAQVVGLEPRCGDGYISAGLGWGGSCLPKDVLGLIHLSEKLRVPTPLVRAVQKINQRQPRLVINKLQKLLGSLTGKTIGILGLSFKPGSDDMRQARSIEVISLLDQHDCFIKAYDPMAMEAAAKILPRVIYCSDAYEVASNSDSLILVTEWDEFRKLDMKKMASLMRFPAIVDSRNLYSPEDMARAGFIYEGIGRRNLKLEREEVGIV